MTIPPREGIDLYSFSNSVDNILAQNSQQQFESFFSITFKKLFLCTQDTKTW